MNRMLSERRVQAAFLSSSFFFYECLPSSSIFLPARIRMRPTRLWTRIVLEICKEINFCFFPSGFGIDCNFLLDKTIVVFL